MAARRDDDAQVIRISGVLYRLEPMGPGVRKVQPLTFAEAARRFIRASELQRRPGTVYSTRTTLEWYVLPVIGRLPVHEVTRDVLLELRESLRTTRRRGSGTVSAGTANLRMIKAMAVLRYAMDELGALVRVPRILPLPSPARKAGIPRARYEALLRALEPDTRLCALLLGDAGLRIGEALALRWRCVRAAELCVCEGQDASGERGPTKSGRVRIVPIGQRLILALAAAERASSSVLPLGWYGSLVRQRLLAACRRARLPALTPHDLRHSYASELQARGVSLTVIRDLLGHSQAAVTDRYLHAQPEELRAAVARLDGD